MRMREFNIKLNEQQLAVIDIGLKEVKLGLSGPVVAHINAQIRDQANDGADDMDVAREQTQQ